MTLDPLAYTMWFISSLLKIKDHAISKQNFKGKKKQIAMKMDFNKAYDTISWTFFNKILISLNFLANWL